MKRRAGILAFPLFLLFFPFFLPLAALTGEERPLSAGDDYLRKGMYLEAIGAYQESADQSKDRENVARSLLRIGDIYSIFLNEPDPALVKYGEVRERYGETPWAANALFNSGMILFEKNRFSEALSLFRQFVSLYPSSDRRFTAEFMIESCLNPPVVPVKADNPPEKAMPADPSIRVLLVEEAPEVEVRSPGAFVMKDASEKTTLSTFREEVGYPVTAAGGGLTVAGKRFSENRAVLVPSGSSPIAVNGTRYRGKIVIAVSGSKINVINVVGLEAYLRGVLPKEMSWSWPPEALKAQAVAARTYALYQKSRSGDKEYDVYGTTSSQVYGGAGVEKAETDRAVAETAGRVLFHHGELVLAYFHSNSGGRTEDAKEVWTAEVPYLKGVRDDFSGIGPSYQWAATVSLEDLAGTLKEKGEKVGRIRKLEPAEKSLSGRVRKIRIVHDGGETVLTGNHFRVKTFPRDIKSTLFSMEETGRKVRFEGKGYGHGVGMSQWGARGMAEKGYTHEAILKHYYSGVELETLGTP